MGRLKSGWGQAGRHHRRLLRRQRRQRRVDLAHRSQSQLLQRRPIDSRGAGHGRAHCRSCGLLILRRRRVAGPAPAPRPPLLRHTRPRTRSPSSVSEDPRFPRPRPPPSPPLRARCPFIHKFRLPPARPGQWVKWALSVPPDTMETPSRPARRLSRNWAARATTLPRLHCTSYARINYCRVRRGPTPAGRVYRLVRWLGGREASKSEARAHARRGLEHALQLLDKVACRIPAQ